MTRSDFALSPINRRSFTRKLPPAISTILLLGSLPAYAKPLSTPELSVWYCKNLHAPFNFAATASSFPFDRLGDVTGSQSTRGEPGDQRISVEKTAKGEDYTLTYSYQYSENNVSQPYGFSLSIDENKRDFSSDPTIFPKAWLSSLGTATYDVMGYEVGAGPPMAGTGKLPTNFSYWTTGRILANWFSPNDISYFSTLCSHKAR